MFLASLLIALQTAPTEASQGTDETTQTTASDSKPVFRNNLLTAFSDICLKNKGSWEQMLAASESSGLDLQKVNEQKKGREVDYLAFPLMISMKKGKRDQHICMAQSVIGDSPDDAATILSTQLQKEGAVFEQLSFNSSKEGVIAKVPVSTPVLDRKMKSEFIEIRLSPMPLADGVIAILVVYPK